jgi:hypothetical protein
MDNEFLTSRFKYLEAGNRVAQIGGKKTNIATEKVENVL